MVCSECKRNELYFKQMKKDLSEIRRTNAKLIIIFKSTQRKLKDESFFESIKKFFYSFFKTKKE